MKKRSIAILGLAGFMLLTLSCEEDSQDTLVWGTLSYGDLYAHDFKALGTLSLEGGDYFGQCVRNGAKLSFIVGSDSLARMNSASAFYFEIKNIEGPPSSGPYVSDGVPRSNEDRGFSGGTIASGGNQWSFDETNINRERCKVILFAKAQKGDLTTREYGKEPFEYLVKIECGAGLDSVTSSSTEGMPLNSFWVELWFDNCD